MSGISKAENDSIDYCAHKTCRGVDCGCVGVLRAEIERLRAALRRAETFVGHPAVTDCFPNDAMGLLTEIRGAIAKAEGK